MVNSSVPGDGSSGVAINPNGPLGQPVGTVRAFLAGGIVATFLVGHLVGAFMLLRGGSPESGLALLGALSVEAGTVTGFYFGVRQTNH